MDEQKNVLAFKQRSKKATLSGWEGKLQCGEHGNVKSTLSNAVIILTNHPAWKGVIAHDLFAERIVFTKPPPWHEDYASGEPVTAGREWIDADDGRLICWFQLEYNFKFAAGSAVTAALLAADRNRIHPVREYLQGLQWDGVSRADQLFTQYFGAEDTAYNRNIARWWLISAVARVVKPGCKADHVPILEGKQGIGKSSGVKAIFGEDWFTDELGDLSSKDTEHGLQGKWGTEIGELEAFSKADVAIAKRFVTRTTDRFRPAYGRRPADFKRQCVFIGTTNDESYLKDHTGSRRYWPVRCGQVVDVEAIRRERDQLWAEALVLYQAGHAWWPTSEEENSACREQQDERRSVDTWEDKVSSWLLKREQTTVGQVLTECLGIEASRQGQMEQNRVGRVLRILGWARKQIREKGSDRRLWVYVRSANPVTTEAEDELVTTLREETSDRLSQLNLAAAESCHHVTTVTTVTGALPIVYTEFPIVYKPTGDTGDTGDNREILDSKLVTGNPRETGDRLETGDREDSQGGVTL